MKQVYYLAGLLATLAGIYVMACSIPEAGFDMFNTGILLIILGQLGFIQGNQQ